MSIRFAPKYNLYICKIVLSLTLFYGNYYILWSQNNTASKAIKRVEQKKEEKKALDEQGYKEALKHQYEIQGKEAQKRMKNNMRVTRKYYNRKLDNGLWQRFWFNIKRKK